MSLNFNTTMRSSVLLFIFLVSIIIHSNCESGDYVRFKNGEEKFFKGIKYRILNEIYSSKYSAVYSALNTRTKKIVVLKHGLLKHESSLLGYVEHEYNQQLKSKTGKDLRDTGLPYAIHRIEAADNDVTLILPYNGITLKDLNHLKKSHNEGKRYMYSVNTLCDIMRQMFNIAGMLHDMNIIHNDLKPQNIMVGLFGDRSSYNKIIFIDLDGAAKLKDGNKRARRFTPIYARPEQNETKEKSKQNDFFAIIIIAMELAGVHPSWSQNIQLYRQSSKLLIYRQTHPGLLNEARKKLHQNRKNKFLNSFLPIIIELLKKLKKYKDEITAHSMKGVLSEKCPGRSRTYYEWRAEFQHKMREQKRYLNDINNKVRNKNK